MDRGAKLLATSGVILLTLSLLNGFLVHALAHPQQLLAAHLVGLIGSGLLVALAGLWPRLGQGRERSMAGALLAVYGFGVGWFVNLLAGLTGRTGIFPISVSSAPGHGLPDALVSIGLVSSAVALFALCAVLVRRLSGVARETAG